MKKISMDIFKSIDWNITNKNISVIGSVVAILEVATWFLAEAQKRA